MAQGRVASSALTMAGVTPNSVFAKNFERLLALRGLARKEAAEAIGVP
jgi:hypothetical protein